MNCIIIEDEVPAQELLISYIEKVPELKLLEIHNSALKANSILKNNSIDVIFLDINLPNISGMSFLKTLQNPPMIIITTAYTNYAVESFEYDTIIDYLVKPFSFERFLKAINKIEARHALPQNIQYQSIKDISRDDEFVFINVDKILHKIKLNSIIYVQSDRNYVTVVSKDLSLSFIDSLKKWAGYLNQDNFIQTHRSYIVNINYIEKLTGSIIYINEQKIPIGKSYKGKLFEKVKPIN